MSIGALLARLRREAGYTQEQLAEALNYGRAYISRIETGHRPPSWRFLVAFANLFSIPLDELLRAANLLRANDAGIDSLIAIHPELAEVFEYAQRHPDIIPDLLRFARFLISEREREKSSGGTPGAD